MYWVQYDTTLPDRNGIKNTSKDIALSLILEPIPLQKCP